MLNRLPLDWTPDWPPAWDEPDDDAAPDALALSAAPDVETDCTTPCALVTVVVTVPLGLSTVVVVVLVDELDPLDEPELEPPPAEAGAETDVGDGEARALVPPALIAAIPLMVMTSGPRTSGARPRTAERPNA